MTRIRVIILNLFLNLTSIQISSENIIFKRLNVKTFVSERLNRVILNEVGKGPVVLEASQLTMLGPLLKSNISKVIVDRNAEFRSYPPRGTIISLANLHELKTMLRRSSLTDCKYILISDSLRPLKNCFERFWKYKILNVVGLVETVFFRRSVNIFTYRPFGSKCGDTSPKLIGVRSDVPTNSSIFPDMRKIKFNRCNLTFTVMSDLIDISIKKNVAKVKGGLMRVFVAVIDYLEMGIQLWTGEDSLDAEAFAKSRWNGIPGHAWEILSGRADFSLGRFSWLNHNYSGAAFPMQIGSECITWAVPYGVGPLPSPWLLNTYQFSSLTWLFIILTIAVASTFLTLLEPTVSVPYLVVLRILLATGSSKLPSSHSSRVFVFHWAIYSLVLTAAYQASTGSLVLVPPESGNIAAKEQVIDSDLILYSDIEMHKLVERNDFGRDFKSRLTLYPNSHFMYAMHRVYSKKDAAVLSSERNIKYAWNNLRRSTNDTHILSIISDCLVKSPTSYFLIREGSYVEAPLHRSLRYLSEAGILKLWENVLEDEPPPRNFSQFKTNHPLSVHQTSGAFFILASGYAAASLAFLLEFLHFNRYTFFKKKGNILGKIN